MTSFRIETYTHQLQFPIGALVISEGVDRLIRAGKEEPFQFLRSHARGDWVMFPLTNGKRTSRAFNPT